MTDWRTLEAGPELDAVVAAAIGCVGVQVPASAGHIWWYLGGKTFNHLPRFTTTWDGMGLVVERMRELGWEGAIYLYNQEPIECIVAPVGDRCKDYDCTHRELGQANTAPLAVCRAALAALEASA